MSETVTFSWPEAGVTPVAYSTKVTCVRLGTIIHPSANDQTSFDLGNFEIGDKVHQETRAVYVGGAILVIAKDIKVGAVAGPTNLRVSFNGVCTLANSLGVTLLEVTGVTDGAYRVIRYAGSDIWTAKLPDGIVLRVSCSSGNYAVELQAGDGTGELVYQSDIAGGDPLYGEGNNREDIGDGLGHATTTL